MPVMRRISSNVHLEALKLNLQRSRERLARLELQVATGKRVLLPSDDPAAAARLVGLKLRVAANEHFRAATHQAGEWLNATEVGIGSVQRILADARLHALQGANDTQDADSRHALAVRVDQLLEELADVSAMQIGNDHLFSGERFDAPPYTFTRDAEGRIDGVVIEPGTGGDVERLVDHDLRLKVNVLASDVFGAGGGGVDSFQVLIDLRDALLANDADGVQGVLDDLTTAEDQAIVELGALGAASGRITQLLDRFDEQQLRLDSAVSESEDADMAAAVIDLKMQETVYQAALQTTARVNQLSLFDFI